MKIGAAIIEHSFKEIKQKVNIAKKIEVDFIQIDMCDGILVPSKTFASNARKDSMEKIQKLCKNIQCELDLMVKNPEQEKWINAINKIKPKSVIIHDKNANLSFIKSKLKSKTGIAIYLNYSKNLIKKLIEDKSPDFVQIMGIQKVGFGGQKLNNKVFDKINFIKSEFPKLKISIDGGVKTDNAKKLKNHGVYKIAVGSGIFKFKKGAKQAVKIFKSI